MENNSPQIADVTININQQSPIVKIPTKTIIKLENQNANKDL